MFKLFLLSFKLLLVIFLISLNSFSLILLSGKSIFFLLISLTGSFTLLIISKAFGKFEFFKSFILFSSIFFCFSSSISLFLLSKTCKEIPALNLSGPGVSSKNSLQLPIGTSLLKGISTL